VSDDTPLKEIRVSPAKYLALLRHVHPLQGQDRALRLLHRIGREGMRVAAANPAFVNALKTRNVRFAGTLAHSALAKTARRYAGAFKRLGLQLKVEETIQPGKGGSRLDIRLEGGKSPIHVIVDWKTTGRSALRSTKQAAKHAAHVLGKHLPQLKPSHASIRPGSTRGAQLGKAVRAALGNRSRVFARHPGALGGKIGDHMALNWQDYLRRAAPQVAKYLPKPKPVGTAQPARPQAKAAAPAKGSSAPPASVPGQGSGATKPVKPAGPPQAGPLGEAVRAALGNRPAVFARHPGASQPGTKAPPGTLRSPRGSQFRNAVAAAAHRQVSGSARQPDKVEPLAKPVRGAARASAPGAKANPVTAAAPGHQLRGSVRAAVQGRMNIGRFLLGSRGASPAAGGMLRAVGSIVRTVIRG